MTLLLASVTDAAEAEVALRHDADIIDVKDVRNGFGAVDPALVVATVDAVCRRRPVSAVTGDPDMEPETVLRMAGALADAGASYIKVGLYPGPKRCDCIRALSALASRARLIGVMFADHGPDEALVALMANNGFCGVMIDTFQKDAKRLLDHMDIAAIAHFTDDAHSRRLMAGLAGSLEPPDIPRLLLAAPDVLGFRRALCAGEDREAPLNAEAIDIVRGLIPKDLRQIDAGNSPSSKLDYGLLAARGYSLEPKHDSDGDRVFLHDFILSVRVGAYAHERGKVQDVRFNVDARVRRADRLAEDMRDVVSYDLIADSIRIIAAQEHIDLVETLAERIAALILTHPRVISVTVRVEKLEVGPGATGVEILRRRPSDVANVHHLYPTAAAAGGDPKVVT
jgi:(5-formylfuran-3-yl)methyl phosphate synthase